MHEEEVDPLGWRLASSIIRGEIDSRQRDRVIGRLWLIDRRFPIEITLRGNPMRDIAGCLMEFENPNPMPEDNEGLSPIQMGVPGIITASRKVRLIDLSASGNMLDPNPFQEVKRVGNAIWIEWFSNANGRVVVHASDFLINISDFSWRMTTEQEKHQIEQSQKAHDHWREIVESENEEDDDWQDWENNNDWYMDEFEWERQFQESDAISKRYMLLMETYLNDPDRDKHIAHEMGWNGPDDEFDDEALEEWEDDDFDEEWAEAMELNSILAPKPETEGIDWIQTDDGRIRHPLSEQATQIVRNIWKLCRDYNKLGDDQCPDIQSMLFHAQTLSAKLAGALDSLAYDSEPDGGFVVACLKRALQSFTLTMKSLGSVAQQNLLPPPHISAFKDELFAIRQEILRLMQHYRNLNDA